MNTLDEESAAIFEVATEDPDGRAGAALDGRASALAAALRRAIPFLFRDNVAVVPEPSGPGSLAELADEPGAPRHTVALRTDPDGAAAVLSVDAIAVAFLLDGALGGSGSSPPALAAEGLTGPQRALLGRLLAGLVPAFAAVLEAGLGVRLRKPATPDEEGRVAPLILVRFRLGEAGAAGTVTLALAREAILSSSSAGRRTDAMNALVAAALGAVELELIVELGRVRLTLRDLAALRVGDVLALPTVVGAAVPVRADGQVLLRGHPTTSGSHVALRVASGTHLERAITVSSQGEPLT
jgi:flagellar motor switch protein FliM